MNVPQPSSRADKKLAIQADQAIVGSGSMRATPARSWFFPVIAVLAITAAGARAPAADDVSPATVYEAAVDMNFRTAARRADALGQGAEADFARALVLLNEQPKTAGKIERARAAFEQLQRADSRSELGIASLYFLARIEHAHAIPTNRPRAEALYRQLMTEHAGSPYAERAFLFYAILRQHAAEGLSAKRAEMLALDAEAERRLRLPVTQRLYHLTAGLAWSRLLQDDERALAHHLRVYGLKLESDYEFANLLARIAELYRRKGDQASALRYYREFLQWAPADRRSGLIGEWVKFLEKGAAP